MEYDEHEDQEEGIEIQPPNYDSSTGRLKMGSSGGCGVEGGVPPQNSLRKGGGTGSGGGIYRYRECLKNHAVNIGAHAVDGCTEFMAAGEEGTLDALKCAACDCHRNFHRKESEGEGEAFHHPHPHPHPHAHHHQHHFAPYYRTVPPAGYLHVTPPPHQRPLALPSTSRDEEDISNPSSSGGAVGGSGSAGGGGGRSGSKKRFRTKFTQDQKDKMLEFAERVGWRIQKQDEEAVQQFCCEMGVKRHVLKVWMHNNKHTLGKKP